MRCIIAFVLLLAVGPLAAQTDASRQKATVEAIDAGNIAHHVGVLANDSMLGRATLSRGIELTAQYVAAKFKKFGLRPGGDSGTWFQRYPVSGRRLDFNRSRIVFTVDDKEAAVDFTSTAYFAKLVDVLPALSGFEGFLAASSLPPLPQELANTGVVLVAGRHTVASVQQADVHGKVVLYVAPSGVDTVAQRLVFQVLLSRSKRLIIVADQDSMTFAKQIQAAHWRPFVRVIDSLVVYVWPAAVQPVLAASGVDLLRTRAELTPVIRELPRLKVQFEVITSAATAPNVVGILKGSDPKLKDEYVVVSAHMDHIGTGWGKGLETLRRGPPQPPNDSIYNGADDNASGTAGVIELAKAFSRPGARPRRSMVFLAVSGEEAGLLGSTHFTDHPPVPVGQIVANINLDMIGRNWKDTVMVAGKEYSDLGPTLDRVAATHPELRVTPIKDSQDYYTRSDHHQFALKGIPILGFFSGEHADYHRVTDSPEKIDVEKEARILRLVFYLGQEIGNASDRPQWNKGHRP